MMLTSKEVTEFQKIVSNYYEQHGRTLPWRGRHILPYQILVSEIMLQQTQVSRVILKYKEFITKFPDFPTLAKSSVNELLKVWQGMGYNRRALYLKRIAEIVVEKHKGKLPEDPDILISFPGIGKATAASICAFAFNLPTIFIETNIRTVFIHHFFKDRAHISDADILPLVERTLDKKNSHIWYWALMDYGTHLKQTLGNLNIKSTHYRKQSPFLTSNRRIRGLILKELTKDRYTVGEIAKNLSIPLVQIEKNLLALKKEGFLIDKNGYFKLAK